MSGDVLGGYALGTLGENFVVAQLFFAGELAFGMSEEVSTVAVEREHEKRFGVEAW